MSQQRQASTDAKRSIVEARPSSSVVLISPQNQVLLLHRVQTSTSFASAHVFPGGNLDEFHDGVIPPADSPERHQDGPAYRLGAIRETFEETGILLAKKDGVLVNLPVEERDAARKKIYGKQVKFQDWLDSLGATPDLAGLVPFTRWITPTANKKRFTTQMYLYLLPLTKGHMPAEMHIPTPDNGVEHTAALFAPAKTFLTRASRNEIILFPPQAYLMTLIAGLFTGKPKSNSSMDGPIHLASQRRKLLSFIKRVPTAETAKGKEHHTSQITWGEKVVSPHNLFVRSGDGRVVLGLDKPGPELKGSHRGGDWERVVLVNFGKGGPTDVEVRHREDVLEEEKKVKAEQEKL
ncbi:Fc.00g020180.m01.CDS01 [Cosmosporella sp. VM-42]